MVHNGIDALRRLVCRYQKILIVHGGSYEHSCVKPVLDEVSHVEFTQFSPNPLYEDVCKGVEVFCREKCDAIVAVGGGSALDTAKCIKLFSGMDASENYLAQEMSDTRIPLIAVPTTAGTGSEVTRHAVIYFRGEKQSISHASIIPDEAVLIPELLIGLPQYQKKCTMLDALCQAIESWWSVNSTSESIACSRLAIQMIQENWRDYIGKNDLKAAGEIMTAANYAGRAINITATTAAHAMSYKLTSLYGLPHGHAVAICLPEVWMQIVAHPERCSDSRGAEYVLQTMDALSDAIKLEEFQEMLHLMGIELPHRRTAGELDLLVASVNPVRLKNNPVFLSGEDLKNMYERIAI